ncbi:MAG: tetratricopeptide repeat protein [Leptospirales bacterium]
MSPDLFARVLRTMGFSLILLFLGGCLNSQGVPSSHPLQETRIGTGNPEPIDPPRPWQSYYHEIQANIAIGLENPYLALDEIQKAIQYRPDSIDLQLQKARLEEQVGQFDSALRTLSVLTHQVPNRLRPWMELAIVKRELALKTADPTLRNEKLNEVISIYLDHVLELDPLKEDAYVALFDLYSRTGEPQKGFQLLQEAVQKNPGSTYLPFYLGFQYIRDHHYNQARKFFQVSLDRNVGFEPGWESLADLSAQQGNWKDAEKKYLRILERIQPGNAEVEAKLLKVYLAENKIPKAISFLGKIIEEHPQNDRFRLILSSLLVEQNRFGLAVDQIQAIIRKNPGNLKLLSFLGSVYERSLHFDQAIDNYRLMIQKFPSSYEGYFDLGDLYRKLSNPKKAVHYLLKAHHLSPEKWQIDFSLALSYADWKKYPKSIKSIHRSMVLKPGNSILYFNRGVIYDQWNHRKYLSRVRSDMEESIRLDPRFPDALNYLGYTDVEDRGDLVQARYLILRALTFDPQNPSYRDSLGWCYFRMGQLFKSFREESLALSNMPLDPTVLSHMGRIERALSRQASLTTPLDEKSRAILSKAGLSGPETATRLMERSQIHLRKAALIHPMKHKRIRRYLKYFGRQDPDFKKELRKARVLWHRMHPLKGSATLYRVRDGDTLQIIAAKGRIYGDPQFWKAILNANKPLIKDPNHLPVGLILRIPRLNGGERARLHSGTNGLDKNSNYS